MKTTIFVAICALFASQAHLSNRLSRFEPVSQSQSSANEQTAPSRIAPSDGRTAPLFDDLGNYRHAITTKSPLAQRYFDQGLTLAYGFNHAEAIRSFKEVARLDPDCAMAYWGVVLALGPNINAPMRDEDVPKAWQALEQAKRLAPKVSAKEQAYIQALAKRYAEQPVADRSALDLAYANAMREVMKRYPDDLDAATLFAEAMMDTMPWNYYTPYRQPKPETVEITTALESVMARNPNHPGANHFYIHAVEASPHPERALPSAYRLREIAPGAGHLVHMPSHIYLQVGRYHDASLANEQAVAADESYIAQCHAQGVYPAGYYPHNKHFLWHTATMEGRSEVSINVAREIAQMYAKHSLIEGERFKPILILTLARFGHWDEALRQPRPPANHLYETAMWRYARGLALIAKRQLDTAARELSALAEIAESKAGQAIQSPVFPPASLIQISRHALAGELARARSQREEMLRELNLAIQLEDKLPYMEPPYWHHPMRQSLGAALLETGKPAEAERVYREALKRHPANGWSLYGLLESLRAQGKTKEAARVAKRFGEAWKHADITLTASRF
jgi:tetratricopeptide (TPR) repeat protein